MKKVIYKIFYVSLIIVFLLSSLEIVYKTKEYLSSRSTNMYIKELRYKNDIVDLSYVNKDYVGWIEINETGVDYPILQADDNNYYLGKDIYNNYSISGSIFLDYRNNEFNDRNTVIYGHNMRDKSMFATLNNYKNEGFLREHNNIIITNRLGREINYKIFSIYVTDINDDYIKTSFDNNEDHKKYLNSIIVKSIYNTNIEVDSVDNILTLSTCAYGNEDDRMVIHAKREN